MNLQDLESTLELKLESELEKILLNEIKQHFNYVKSMLENDRIEKAKNYVNTALERIEDLEDEL